MALLYDSDNPDSIPNGVWAAGYVDGYAAPAWNARGWSRFPNAKRIAVFGQTNDGDVLDVERGDATPSEAPIWVQWRRAAGIAMPWVYVNRSNRAAVENALIAAGILSDQVALWVATLDNTQTVPAGRYPVAAVQYANSLISGGHYDLSIVSDRFGAGGSTITGGDSLDANNPVDAKVITDTADAATILRNLGNYEVGKDAIATWKLLSEFGSTAVGAAAIAAGAAVPTINDVAATVKTLAAQQGLPAQAQADMHTIAEFLRKLGIP